MSEVNGIFTVLEQDNSRLFKTAFLSAHSENEDLKQAIHLALNPLIQFYIRKIPKYTSPTADPVPLNLAMNKLEALTARKYTGNMGIDYLASILSSVSPGDAEVIKRIIEKDLRCGVSIATANAVWPGLVPDYPVMLCSAYNERLLKQISWPAIVQIKEDGMRFNAVKNNGGLEFRSRNGKLISLHHCQLIDEFSKFQTDHVYDGELLVYDLEGKLMDRKTGNGILNKAVKGTISEAECQLIHAIVWDCIPYADFKKGYCGLPYNERMDRVIDQVKKTGLYAKSFKDRRIHEIGLATAENLNMALGIFNELTSKGFEGIIIKEYDAPWEAKRSQKQIKVKAEEDCELRIIEVVEGTGKYVGMVGSFICETEDGEMTTGVGSGLSDAQRVEYWKNQPIGKICKVQYNMKIENKLGAKSLFLPIFLEIREDKDVANTFAELK